LLKKEQIKSRLICWSVFEVFNEKIELKIGSFNIPLYKSQIDKFLSPENIENSAKRFDSKKFILNN
jgi:hypothetical protein